MVKWKNNFYSEKADPESIYLELRQIGEDFSPKDIVNFARNENTALHSCFTWDDTEAAEKWRLQEARTIVSCLVYDEDESDIPQNESKKSVRVYYSLKDDKRRGYAETKVIVRDEDKYKQLLKQALSELNNFRTKYAMLKELNPVFNAIDSIA